MILQENHNNNNCKSHHTSTSTTTNGVEIKTAKKVNVSTTRAVYRGTSSSMEQSSKGSGDIRFTGLGFDKDF